MWCSCYYSFYFNALKRYPIPTPGVGLHNFTPITSVIIGDIPPGGYFWEKIPSLTSTHHCAKTCPLFHRVFHRLHVRRNSRIVQTTILYISTIYSYTQLPSYLIRPTSFHLPSLNNIILFIPLSILFHCPIQSIKLLSFSILYHIYYCIILLTILSLSILSIQSNFYYYISLP